MRVRTREEKKISDLLHTMSLVDIRIISEIEEIQRGNEHSSKDILEGIEYILEERFAFMIRDENKPE